MPPLLFSFFSLFSLAFPFASAACNQFCGSSGVPYPFGFSADCHICLNCSSEANADSGESEIRIGEFPVRNITRDTILIDVPPNCDRPVTQALAFFGANYAMTWNNALLLRQCPFQLYDCVIPTDLLSRRFDFDFGECGPKSDNISCYPLGRLKGFVAREYVINSRCGLLFSTIAYAPDKQSLDFRTVVLGWWLEGNCSRCSENASCGNITSPVTGRLAVTCSCHEGFEGDGFSAGRGCRKVSTESSSCSASNYMSGACGGKGSNPKLKIAVGAIGAVVGFISMCLFFIYFGTPRRIRNSMPFWKKKSKSTQTVEVFLEKYGSLTPKRYKYPDIKKITKSFSDKIGQGGYGAVFKGKLHDGRPVAVKVFSDSKGNGEDFVNEVASIGRTYHVNVVTLLGFCAEGTKRALIYEFMPNGSLDKFIFAGQVKKPPIDWEKLYEIAIGIARGLEYLHRGCITRIVHFDIKPHNILLDQDFCPKISDFGLAKLGPAKDSIVSMAGARGTVGYIAPEVFSRNFGVVSSKSDVYSYGMMVLEMVGGRKNWVAGMEHTSEVYFPHWVYEHLDRDGDLGVCGVTDEIEEVARKMIMVGLWCIQTNPGNRPSMGKVMEMLEGRTSDLEMPPKPYLSSFRKRSFNGSSTSLTS